MKTRVAIITVVIIIFSVVIFALAGSEVFSQQIISNDFNHTNKDLYVSPEINLIFKSQGSIQWNSGHNNTHFYLVPASQISKINRSNAASLSYTPIKYAEGKDTYVYQGLTGSFYVVAVSGTNPSGFASYQFSHPPYTSDPSIGGPSVYNLALEIFFGSFTVLIIITGLAAYGPIRKRIIQIRDKGGTVRKSISVRLRKGSVILIRGASKRKGFTVLIVIILVFAMFSLVQYETRPVVTPILPVSDISSGNVTGKYIDNTSFELSSPGVSSKYYATVTGPVPQEGGINSTQLYSWGYSLQITKVNQTAKIFGISQAPVVKNITVSIGNYNLQFTMNSLDVNYIYYNGVLCTNPSGTFNTGTEYAIYVSLTNEISAKIPDGNYTMHIEVSIYPESVFGPYHFSGGLKTMNLSYPVYVNNANIISNSC